jgi:hypothetical protein
LQCLLKAVSYEKDKIGWHCPFTDRGRMRHIENYKHLKAKNAVPHKYYKILVLGLIRTADRTIKGNMENHMAGDLKVQGYYAVSSVQEYGPNAFDKTDEQTAA